MALTLFLIPSTADMTAVHGKHTRSFQSKALLVVTDLLACLIFESEGIKPGPQGMAELKMILYRMIPALTDSNERPALI